MQMQAGSTVPPRTAKTRVRVALTDGLIIRDGLRGSGRSKMLADFRSILRH